MAQAKQLWTTPLLIEYGSLVQLTTQLDKRGDSDDIVTWQLPTLDGSIVPD
jgi:hypothetical protein